MARFTNSFAGTARSKSARILTWSTEMGDQKLAAPVSFWLPKTVPELMFFLGRWSGTAIFPLMGEMIADTIAHIRKVTDMLTYVDVSGWYKEEFIHGRPIADFIRTRNVFSQEGELADFRTARELDDKLKQHHPLVRASDMALAHFGKGTLFAGLRGEVAR